MKTHILTYKDISEQKDISLFVDTIYNNFIDLKIDYKLMHNKEDIEKNLRSLNTVIIIITNDSDKIIGFLTSNIMVLEDRRKVLYISYIYVSESERNKKLGSLLLKEAEKYASKQNCIGVMLIFDTYKPYLVNFYETRGYMLDINLRRYERHDVYYKTL